jgi:hypothetical protein
MSDSKLKKSELAIGVVGKIPLAIEPWKEAFLGECVPGLKVPFPPKIYSQKYSSPDYYDLKHGQYYLGFWEDGKVTLCQADNDCDYCWTAEGKVYGGGGGFCGPSWIMPLEVCEGGLGDDGKVGE